MATGWFCMKSILENVFIPNNADIFIYTGKIRDFEPRENSESNINSFHSSYDSRHTEYGIEFDEKLFFGDLLGHHLKAFEFCQDDSSFDAELKQLCVKAHKLHSVYTNGDINSKYNSEGIRFSPGWNQPQNYVINQYLRLQRCIQLMKKYEDENNFKYDIIIRLRPDMAWTTKTMKIQLFESNTLYTSNKRFYPHLNDYFFWGSRDVMDKICSNFVYKLYNTLKPYHRLLESGEEPNGDITYITETQFALFVKELSLNLESYDNNCGLVEFENTIDHNEISRRFKIDKVVAYRF
jgi:hypothetical protein